MSTTAALRPMSEAASPAALGRAPLRCLVVRPPRFGNPRAGDEIVYGRSLEVMARSMTVETLELQSVSRARQLVNLIYFIPPEATRYISAANTARLQAALAKERFDVVCFFNEVTFPLLHVVKRRRIPAVLVAHNVHSVVARSEPTLVGRAFRLAAEHFERRWYADPDAALVCISNGDVAGLQASGVDRVGIAVAPPGAPPASPLAPPAPVIAEAVITGSYYWWRKNRDLKKFAAGPPIGVPVLVDDPVAAEALGEQGVRVEPKSIDWSAGLRFGLITDRFAGGFKLKSLEYVANNCVIISFCDLSPELGDLPHAAEFVRFVRDKGEVARVISEVRAAEPACLIERFLQFKAACLARYDWNRCLQPLVDTLERAARGSAATASDAKPGQESV